MAANVENMFYTREKPWHGLGTMVMEAPTSKEALQLAGLDWTVIQKEVITKDGFPISGFKANVRETDNRVLGIVTNRYKVVQNQEAFAFTDALLGEGVTYETAGSLKNGCRIWLLAKLPQPYMINGDEITPYLVFMNSHDGSGAIKAAMTPVRVVCENTLNLALRTAKRSWSTNHTGNMAGKLKDAKDTLLYAADYMAELEKTMEFLHHTRLSDKKVNEYIERLIPLTEDTTAQQKKNLHRMREELKIRYYEAPDLQDVGKNAYRFVNAVSDFVTHAKPLRERNSYRENLFARVVDGNTMLDKAYEMVKAA